MQYLCFTFTLTPASEAAYDLLADALAGAGFDSFVHTDELDLPRVAFRDNFPESAVFADKADTIVGKNQKSALLTLVERTTRYTIICKLKNLKAEDTAQ